MTESQLRSKIANWPVQYLGISEGSTSHLNILNVFNSSGLCARYKMTKNDHWCATTVSAAFIANGMAGKPGSGSLFECVECSCGYMIDMAKTQGIWVESDAYIPKVGDIILYDWGDTGNGDNTGWPDHVGIVITAGDSSFKVIEGNMNNTVGYRTMSVNGRYIRGFITPDYSKFATKGEATATNITLNKSSKFKGTVNTTMLNVRMWAGTKYDLLRKIGKGTIVDVCDIIQDSDGDDWYYIKESGKYGFVCADYITKESTSTSLNKTCKFKGVVTASVLNVRSWAGTEYSKLRTLDKGTTVDVCDTVKASTGKTWYYIKKSGKYGFVCADYISRV